MPEEPLSGRRGARHELPASPGSRLVSVLLGVTWLAGSVAAGVIAFRVTGQSEQPGLGAGLVGYGCGLLAFVIGAQISVYRDRRRHPRAGYWAPRWYTISQTLRHNKHVMAGLVALVVLGLWLRHRYG
jgi:hypothetical protein